MKRLVIVLSMLLAGCIHQPSSAPRAPTVEQLRAEHRYVSALKTLDATALNAPDYTQRRTELVEDANAYQATLLDELAESMRQQAFADAERRLADAQRELPSSSELERFSDNLHLAAERFRQRNLDDIVQLRSTILLKEQPLYRALEKASDDDALRQLIERQRADTDFFAAQLEQLGTRALAQNDFTRAAQYLGQANQLKPSDDIAQQLKRAEQALAASKQKRQTARSTEREQHYREASAALQQSMQQSNYAVARSQLEQLKALAIHNDEVDAVQQQLDRAIAAFVDSEIDAGNRLYSDGHLEEALVRWRSAATLAPSPQLTERIEKAQRFIDRFEQLRAKQN